MTCGRRWIEWDAECCREVVAPATRENSQRGPGAGQPIDPLVYGSIAAAHQHALRSTSGRIARQGLHLPTRRGHDNLEIVAELANDIRGGKRDPARSSATRGWVDK